MTFRGPAPAAGGRSLSLTASSLSIAFDHADRAGPSMGITVYGCEQYEAALFREMAPRFGVLPTITEAPTSDANIALASGHSCISVGHKTQISSTILRGLRRVGVRYVSTRSVGYDHIDLQCAQDLGMSVENVAYSPDSVADYTLMLMLMLLRNAKSTLSRAQVHDYRLHCGRGKELRDLTVGIIGTGRIGQAVMVRLRGFGCRVLAYDCCPMASADVPLDALLEQSDVVTLHTPLNSDTYHLLNRHRIGQMKPGAFVVNTGRGSLLDSEALLSALEDGRLGGAALDVLEGEEGVFYSDHSQRPIKHQLLLRLQQLPDVLITPHTAYFTDHALRDTVENTLANCLAFERRAAWIG